MRWLINGIILFIGKFTWNRIAVAFCFEKILLLLLRKWDLFNYFFKEYNLKNKNVSFIYEENILNYIINDYKILKNWSEIIDFMIILERSI